MKTTRHYWSTTDNTFRALATLVERSVRSCTATNPNEPVAELAAIVMVKSSGHMEIDLYQRSSLDAHPVMPDLIKLAIRSAIPNTPPGKIPILVIYEDENKLAAYAATAGRGEDLEAIDLGPPPDEAGRVVATASPPSEVDELKGAVDAFLDSIGGLSARVAREGIMFAVGRSGAPIVISIMERAAVLADPDLPSPLREAAVATIARTPAGCLPLVSLIDVGEETRIRGSLVATEDYLASGAKA